jgi:S1-C subfamily serine protease
MDRLLSRKFKAVFGVLKIPNGDVQTNLYPITWSFPTPWPNRPTRFGAVVEESQSSSGVAVTQVYDQSAAEKITIAANGAETADSLRPGDIILRIENEQVSNEATYREMVDSASKRMYFEFKRGSDLFNAYVDLAW